MPSLNKVFLMGNLTRSPELRYTPSGVAICEFGLALNRRFMSNGVRKEETTFLEINVWQRQAEICKNRLQKGSLVMIEGRLKSDHWEDRDTGKKRSRILVVAERVNFVAMPPKEDHQEDYEGEDSGGQNKNNKTQYNNRSAQNRQRNYHGQNQPPTQNPSQAPVRQKQENHPPPPEPENDDAPPEDDGNENIPF